MASLGGNGNGTPAAPTPLRCTPGGRPARPPPPGGVTVKAAVHVRPLTSAEREAGVEAATDLVCVSEGEVGAPLVQLPCGDVGPAAGLRGRHPVDFVLDGRAGSSADAESAAVTLWHDFVGPAAAEAALRGEDAVVLVYGRSGSGKTWLLGCEAGATSRERAPGGGGGFVQMASAAAAAWMRAAPPSAERRLGISAIEIGTDAAGRERCLDLASGLPVPLHQEGEGWVAGGVIYVNCGNDAEGAIDEVVTRACAARATAETASNERSSRSHLLFTLSMTQTGMAGSPGWASRLVLVDLAGSERVGELASALRQSGTEAATPGRRAEGLGINRGLLSLGRVIGDLRCGRVPAFRENTLTKLLAAPLTAGHAVFVGAVAPRLDHAPSTRETLDRLREARGVVTLPRVRAFTSGELDRAAKNAADAALAEVRSELDEERSSRRRAEDLVAKSVRDAARATDALAKALAREAEAKGEAEREAAAARRAQEAAAAASASATTAAATAARREAAATEARREAAEAREREVAAVAAADKRIKSIEAAGLAASEREATALRDAKEAREREAEASRQAGEARREAAEAREREVAAVAAADKRIKSIEAAGLAASEREATALRDAKEAREREAEASRQAGEARREAAEAREREVAAVAAADKRIKSIEVTTTERVTSIEMAASEREAKARGEAADAREREAATTTAATDRILSLEAAAAAASEREAQARKEATEACKRETAAVASADEWAQALRAAGVAASEREVAAGAVALERDDALSEAERLRGRVRELEEAADAASDRSAAVRAALVRDRDAALESMAGLKARLATSAAAAATLADERDAAVASAAALGQRLAATTTQRNANADQLDAAWAARDAARADLTAAHEAASAAKSEATTAAAVNAALQQCLDAVLFQRDANADQLDAAWAARDAARADLIGTRAALQQRLDAVLVQRDANADQLEAAWAARDEACAQVAAAPSRLTMMILPTPAPHRPSSSWGRGAARDGRIATVAALAACAPLRCSSPNSDGDDEPAAAEAPPSSSPSQVPEDDKCSVCARHPNPGMRGKCGKPKGALKACRRRCIVTANQAAEAKAAVVLDVGATEPTSPSPAALSLPLPAPAPTAAPVPSPAPPMTKRRRLGPRPSAAPLSPIGANLATQDGFRSPEVAKARPVDEILRELGTAQRLPPSHHDAGREMPSSQPW